MPGPTGSIPSGVSTVVSSGGAYQVEGTHTYLDERIFPVSVVVTDSTSSATFTANATILEELLRVKAVRRMPDGRLKALSRTYATVRWDPEGVVAFGEHVAELCATLLHNLNFPERSYAVRRVLSLRLNPRYVPMLRRDLEQQVAVLADSVDHTLNDPAHSVRRKATPPEAAALGLTVFVFEPHATEETALQNEERPARTVVSGRHRVRVRGLKERDAARGKS